jgi:uncharacterized protein (DUF2344 family)
MEIGRVHDFNLFKQYFADKVFLGQRIWVDLGFQSIEKYIDGAEIMIPHKKKKGQDLSKEQKEENKIMARTRVLVENAIARIKRFFILRIENRMHKKYKLDMAAELCACLSNFAMSG